MHCMQSVRNKNVGHVNDKKGKSQQYQLHILTVKLIEKGDLYLKNAKVSMLLLLCAVARGVKEKRKNALHSQFSCKMQKKRKITWLN